METHFQRAKSRSNKQIRMHQIMEVTDRLFHEGNYHDLSLSVIARELGLARGGLYKYVSTKEEIFLMIYLEKQGAFLQDLCNRLLPDTFAKTFAKTLETHLDFLKYHQILNAIIETNVSVERLARFKADSHQQQTPLLQFLNDTYNLDEAKAFDFYLTLVYHGVYLYDRVAYQDIYTKAMTMAGLKIVPVSFQDQMMRFIDVQLQNLDTLYPPENKP